MKSRMHFALCVLAFLSFCLPVTEAQSTQGVKFVADTLIVEAEGTYEADPDVATLAFDISAQEKELKSAYAKASQSIKDT